MKKQLIILIASNLKKNGGGRETWLNNFVNHDSILSFYEKISIVGYGEKSGDSIEVRDNVTVVLNQKSKLFPMFGYLLSTVKTLRHIDGWGDNTTIIACGSWFELVALVLYKVFFHTKATTVCWLRSIVVKELSRYYNPLLLYMASKIELMSLKKMDIVISNGLDTAEHYNRLGINSTTISNAIYSDQFLPTSNFSAPQIVYFGRLSEEKGITQFVKAVHKLLEIRDDFLVKIIGPGNAGLLESIICKRNVEYLGALSGNELLVELAKSNIAVHLTLSGQLGGGGVSHSVIESLAVGHLIVCWDSPIYNQVSNQNNLLKVQEPNIDDLINSISVAIDIVNDGQFPTFHKVSITQSLKFSFHSHVNSYLELVSKEL